MLIASIVLIIIWNIIWVCALNPHKNKVMVGTGDKDDPDNYEEQNNGMYIAGYVLFGLLLLALVIAFIAIVEQYKDKMGDGNEEDDKEKAEKDS